MISLLFKRLTILVILTVIGLWAVNCKESTSDTGSSIGVFTFLKGDVNVNGSAAKLGDNVKKGDSVVSKKRSAAVIQFSHGALLTMKASSEIDISNLSKSERGQNIVLAQNKGSTFSKIISSEKVQYTMNSPTLVAGVRGTSFEVNVDREGGTEVKLLKGKVAVQPASSEEETILAKGSKLKVTQTYGMSEPQKLTKTDVEQLKALEKIELVPDIEKKASLEDSDFENVVSTEAQSVVQEMIKKKKKYTLTDLKKEYGKISKIITTSGKVYIGNFLQKGSGKAIQIRTVEGQFTIMPNEIRKVEPF